jgi:hypothetical protein
VADSVLVADPMQRFSDDTGVRADLFTHPYAAICRDIGLEVLEMMMADDYGHFLARTAR